MNEHIKANFAASIHFDNRGFHQIQFAVIDHQVFRRVIDGQAVIKRFDVDGTISTRAQRAVGVPIDRRAQHAAAVLLRKGRNIRAATGEADS